MDAVSHQIKSTDFSDAEIAEICGTSTEFVRRERMFQSRFPFIERDSITELDDMPNKIPIPYDDLHREYIENEKTIEECAEHFGCSMGVILNRMNEYGIPARPRGGSKKKEETSDDSEKMATLEPTEFVHDGSVRSLERLMFLAAVKEASIQELLEEALELLFEKHRKEL